jgi:hypothetical protein
MCQYRKDINKDEIGRAKDAVQLYARLVANEITAAEYSQKLNNLAIATLSELVAASQTWSCPRCQESVPVNFNECWNCKTTQKNLPIPGKGQSFTPPNLPYGITRPVHPWE